jgi:hypothetical protein
LAREEQAAAVAPLAMAGWETSIKKKWVGRMGGRAWYSAVTVISTLLWEGQAGRMGRQVREGFGIRLC